MLSKQNISKIRSLSQKKVRMREKLFVAEGPKVCEELLQSDLEVTDVFGESSWFSSNMHLLKSRSTRMHEVDGNELKKISFLRTPNEVLCIARIPEKQALDEKKALLCLDEINDPGNLGTILRTADWFGVEDVLLSNSSVDPYNEKTVMASMGSLFRVNLHQTDLGEFLMKQEAGRIYAAHPRGGNASGPQIDNPIFLFGSESHGLGSDLLKVSGNRITIPGAGKTESLNLGISVGIVLSGWFQNR